MIVTIITIMILSASLRQRTLNQLPGPLSCTEQTIMNRKFRWFIRTGLTMSGVFKGQIQMS